MEEAVRHTLAENARTLKLVVDLMAPALKLAAA
jgi:hypothetical protein